MLQVFCFETEAGERSGDKERIRAVDNERKRVFGWVAVEERL